MGRGVTKGRLAVERKYLLRSQKGFTLIEIISVLVLLGILAAVAMPKFFDLQTQSRLNARAAALSEGASQVHQAAAFFLLTTGAAPTTLANLTGLAAPNNLTTPWAPAGSSFSLTFAGGPLVSGRPSITVTATGIAGTPVATVPVASLNVPIP